MSHVGDAGDSFGARVRRARLRLRSRAGLRLTQGELAAAVGVERNTITRWENGGAHPRDPETLRTLARVLRVSTDWLIDGRMAGAGLTPPGRVSDGGAGGASDAAAGDLSGLPPGVALQVEAELAGVPPGAAELIRSYVTRMAAAGVEQAQLAAGARLLLEGARNAVARTPFTERDAEVVAEDVDAAWDFVTRILRRDGVRP